MLKRRIQREREVCPRASKASRLGESIVFNGNGKAREKEERLVALFALPASPFEHESAEKAPSVIRRERFEDRSSRVAPPARASNGGA